MECFAQKIGRMIFEILHQSRNFEETFFAMKYLYNKELNILDYRISTFLG